jgi:hypothetical protein
MDPNPSRLNDPQRTGEGVVLQHRQEISQSRSDLSKSCPRPKLKDDNSGALFRRKSGHLPEIAVERDELAPRRSKS